jgi:hypothetical protein
MTFDYMAFSVIAFLIVAYIWFVRWHVRWLAQQSPVGVWVASLDTGTVTIQFDGGPREGLYKQLTETEDGADREFGSWATHLNTLELLILASDQKGHPRFGQSTKYELKYVGPKSILIFGPDRPYLRYERAAEGTTVDIEPEETS